MSHTRFPIGITTLLKRLPQIGISQTPFNDIDFFDVVVDEIASGLGAWFVFLKFCDAGSARGGVECEFGNEGLDLYEGLLCKEVKFELFHVLGSKGQVTRLGGFN